MWCPTPNQGQGSTTSEKWNEAGFGSVEEMNNCNHNNIVLRRTMVNIPFIIILAFFLELNAFSSCVNLTHFANEFCLDVFCSFRWRYNIQLQFHMFDASLSMMNTWFWFFVKPVVVHSLHYKEVSSRLAVGDLEDIGWNIIELTFWKHFCIYI